jgi:Flp pilus assembly protein TadD
MDQARERFYHALELGGSSPELRGRIEQNLGILANIRGDHAEALAHYHNRCMRSSGPATTTAALSRITIWGW